VLHEVSVRSASIYCYLFLLGTYAVESVSLSSSTGPFIDFICQFSAVLSAEGCVIRLSVNGVTQYESNGSRTDNTAVVSFCGVVDGVYELSAFDIDDNQPSLITSSTAAVHIKQLNISTIQLPSDTVNECPKTGTATSTVYTATSANISTATITILSTTLPSAVSTITSEYFTVTVKCLYCNKEHE